MTYQLTNESRAIAQQVIVQTTRDGGSYAKVYTKGMYNAQIVHLKDMLDAIEYIRGCILAGYIATRME